MQEIIAKITAKDDKFPCVFADKIIAKSRNTDAWYEYFAAFASLRNHPKSLVRNRTLHILAANTQWDVKNRFDSIFAAGVRGLQRPYFSVSPFFLTKKYSIADITIRNGNVTIFEMPKSSDT